MSKQVNISNNNLSITISTLGAEIISIKKGEKEIIWQAEPSIWPNHAPLLFPFCGNLKDGKFTYEGKEYFQPRHGFGRTSEFEIEKNTNDEVVFFLTDNEETLKNYPFKFELRVSYKLENTTLTISYNIKNLTTGDMYFSIGSHEAYNCPEGIDAYTVIFEKPEKLIINLPAPNGGLGHDTRQIGNDNGELQLSYKFFDELDSLIFTNLKSRKATLKNNITGDKIEISFPGKDYFLIWTKPQAKYICLEPWCGICYYGDGEYDITKKEGMTKLSENETFDISHTITF